jgi:hypothetical protein
MTSEMPLDISAIKKGKVTMLMPVMEQCGPGPTTRDARASPAIPALANLAIITAL